jgi:hypothetical protein
MAFSVRLILGIKPLAPLIPGVVPKVLQLDGPLLLEVVGYSEVTLTGEVSDAVSLYPYRLVLYSLAHNSTCPRSILSIYRASASFSISLKCRSVSRRHAREASTV